MFYFHIMGGGGKKNRQTKNLSPWRPWDADVEVLGCAWVQTVIWWGSYSCLPSPSQGRTQNGLSPSWVQIIQIIWDNVFLDLRSLSSIWLRSNSLHLCVGRVCILNPDFAIGSQHLILEGLKSVLQMQTANDTHDGELSFYHWDCEWPSRLKTRASATSGKSLQWWSLIWSPVPLSSLSLRKCSENSL